MASLAATVRPTDLITKQNLVDFGQYVGQCMPKYVQKVQITNGDELEIMIHPDGVVPVITFLKDHTNSQFVNVADICAVDIPTRKYRFEVGLRLWHDFAAICVNSDDSFIFCLSFYDLRFLMCFA